LAVGVVIGMLMISPAGAHVTSSFSHLYNTHIKPKLANPGTINSANNPVDWTKLKGVPADFADGVDDTGGPPGPASDVVCMGCVTSSDLGAINVRLGSAVAIPGGVDANGDYNFGTATVACLPGEVAISGGAEWSFEGTNGGGGVITVQSEPLLTGATPTGWRVRGGQDTAIAISLQARVLCLAA
jgi:hypothetical protein